MSSWLVYGPFSLADADEAAVDVRLWCNTDAGDHLSLMASVDGDSFYGVVLSGTSDGWVQHRLDLTAVHGLGDVTGRDAVWFAAIFDSDGATTLAEGAYLDDVMIWKRSRGLSAAAAAGRLPPSGLREVESSRARPGAGS